MAMMLLNCAKMACAVSGRSQAAMIIFDGADEGLEHELKLRGAVRLREPHAGHLAPSEGRRFAVFD